MPGFRHSPFEDIQRIRQDLRDRYRDGFPILKELLQNADDAGAGQVGGAATRSVIILALNGLPAGQHVLLRGAGLCILNDGNFTAEDANSITSLGLSNKAGQSDAAGKFGLGLKSIFHWAEAFFYLSPYTFDGNPRVQAAGCDLLNPWWSRYAETGRHKEWDDEWTHLQNGDRDAFASFAHRLLETERWFGLWIPLRIKEHTRDEQGEVKPIENQFPEPDINELFGSDWHERLVETLPMLRRVRTVLVCRNAGAGSETLAAVRVNGCAERMCWGLPDGPLAGAPVHGLGGTIKDAETSMALSFSGFERFAEIGSLNVLRNHHAWPSQSAIGADGGGVQIREKAEPHGAVVFTRQNGNGYPVLRVQHAVFLPLGEPELVNCKGRWRYNLYLHAFFFVDSGRRNIQDVDDLPPNLTPDKATSESEVIRLWNRILMREVVGPLVLPSLDAFVRQEQMEPADVESLVSALDDSKTLKKLTEWMCRGQRFIPRLSPSGGHWALETCPVQGGDLPRWIELPAPDFPETELFGLLPALTDLSSRVSVSLKGKPSLAHQRAKRVSDDELAELLGGVSISAFDDARQLDYLLKLIPEDASQRRPDSPLTTSLVKLAKQLVRNRLPEEKELKALWREFFRRFPPKAFIRLPCDSTKTVPEIARVLAEANLPVALVWQDFSEAEDQGTLGWEGLLSVLRSLARLRLHEESAVRQRSDIAVRLLKACELRPQDWADFVADLLLFHTRQPGGPACAASIADLRTAHVEERLFTGGNPWSADLAKAAPEVKPLLVEKEVADILDLAASDCEAAACAKLLRKASRLADDFASRKPLFERLLGSANQIGADAWAALRCLLHGQVSQWEQTVPLFREGNDQAVFIGLARKALAAACQPWRHIPAHIADHLALNAEQEKRLNLVASSANHVEALVKEVGPEKVDCADLPREDCDVLLQQFNEAAVLAGLNIHDTLDSRVRVGKHTYVDDGAFTELPPAFDRLITRIRDNANYARFTSPEGSNRLVLKLNWEAVVNIALDQDQPTDWASTILTAIGRLGNLRSELKRSVLEVAWLPLVDGTPVAPKTLLHVPGAEAELEKLPDDILAGRIPLLRLAELVRHHERFETFKITILPPSKEALATLATLLQPHAVWSTGLSGEWTDEQVVNWVKALGNAPERALPIARLAKVFYGESSVRELLPDFLQRLRGAIAEPAYAEVLMHLSAAHANADENARQRAEGVFLRYLKAIADGGDVFASSLLARPGITLLSSTGSWTPPGQLTFVRNGVDPDDIISPTFEPALARFIRPAAAVQVMEARLPFPWPGEMPQRLAATAQRLREYFEPWRNCLPSPEPIGLLLSVMGTASEIEAAAESFLLVYTIDGIRDWLNEHEERRRLPLSRRIKSCDFILEGIERGETIEVLSILGTPFFARRNRGTSSVFVGDERDAFQVSRLEPGRVVCQGRLLDLGHDLENLTPQELVELLEGSMRIILGFLEAEVDTTVLWDAAMKASQLHVRVAQSMIIDGAIGFLRQVGAQRHPQIKQALAKWDEARRIGAEEECQGMGTGRSEQRRLEARAMLQQLLSENTRVQGVVLGAVRGKISEFQYSAASVPFEIWQNADDAVAELDRLGRDAAHAVSFGFVASLRRDACCFIHLGRLINEFRCSGGHNCRDDGFDRDLEKMLVLAISDKGEAAERGGPMLTGKFGLGFKSLFLFSDAPEVLSGSVDFVIRGGIYPVRLVETQRNVLLEALKMIAPDDWRRGTIIHLPLRADGSIEADNNLALFRRLVPLLVVFSRRLKRVRFLDDGHLTRELQWRPKSLFNVGTEFGELAGLDDNITAVLVLSSNPETGKERLTFLLGMNAHGMVPLPGDVPVFWVTAPTRATPSYGFAVNGPFEPDVGRVQLAGKSAAKRADRR